MIPYNKRAWAPLLFDVRGSMVWEIFGRVAACVIWALIVVTFHHGIRFVHISPTPHTLVGVALGLLLVFRTNASYDRFWEGRRQWGNIINESRNLVRGARAYFAGDGELLRTLALWSIAFPYAAMHSLRSSVGLGPVARRLPPAEVEAALASGHVPLAVSVRVSEQIAEARNRGTISDYVAMTLDQNVQLLIDALGACERIYKTPLPFVYVVHLRRALVLYCFTLPFALVEHYAWWTVLATLFVSYTFFGIEEIGVEIENPFGLDRNDLPLDQFCRTIEANLLEVAGIEGPGERPAKIGVAVESGEAKGLAPVLGPIT